MRRFLLLFVSLLVLLQPACIWKLWSKGGPPEERVFDVYGTVREINLERLIVEIKGGRAETFHLTGASTKGSNFQEGAYVHVYYKEREVGKVVTLVVEKIN